MKQDSLYAVIMAGGRGERFWPAGRKDNPKQLLPLLGEKTMLEETVLRLFPLIAPERVMVITNLDYVDRIRELLPIPPENIIGEPERRDTAPCVALATALIRRKDPDATMILLPADHVIRPAKLFQQTLLAAAEQAQNGKLATLGILPTYPATGYGYIELGDAVNEMFHTVKAFREKPDQPTAEQFFLSGNYRWNGGIFVWRCDVISEEFRKHAPQLSEKLEHWANGGDWQEDFAQCQKISIDYAIMEKSRNVIVGNAPFYWNDIGSWSALRSVLPKDERGNAARGNVLAISSNNNVLISDDDTLLGVIGMNDIAVIKSGNGLLVCPLSEEQRVRELVGQIKDAEFV